jgi:hypothetical protein
MFFMRIGVLKFRQRWLDREVSESLTAAAVLGILAVGFVAGFATSKLLDSWDFLPLPQVPVSYVLGLALEMT